MFGLFATRSGRHDQPQHVSPSGRRAVSPPRPAMGTAAAPPTTTRLFTHEAILRQFQSDVSDKVDLSLAAHHMTYGVLLREIEALVSERQALRQEILDHTQSGRATAENLAAALRHSEQLEETVSTLRDDVEEKERLLLQWSQRYERTQQDVRELRNELERAVKDADQNRTLLAAEVRNRAALLTSMHEDIRSDLQKTLFVREGSHHLQSTTAATATTTTTAATSSAGVGVGAGSSSYEHNTPNSHVATLRRRQSSPEPRQLPSSNESNVGGATTPTTLRQHNQQQPHFQQLEDTHRELVNDVRRQLACDVPRVVDVHNVEARLHAAETTNGAHHRPHQTTTTALPSHGTTLSQQRDRVASPFTQQSSSQLLPPDSARYHSAPKFATSPPPPPSSASSGALSSVASPITAASPGGLRGSPIGGHFTSLMSGGSMNANNNPRGTRGAGGPMSPAPWQR